MPIDASVPGQARWTTGTVALDLLTGPDAPVRVRSLRPAAVPPPDEELAVNLVELNLAGHGRRHEPPGTRHRTYAAADGLRLVEVAEQTNAAGNEVLVVRQAADNLEVVTRLEAWTGTPVLRATTEVINRSDGDLTLTYVSSLALAGFGGGLRSGTRIHQARNSWCAELRWQVLSPEQAGLVSIIGSGISKDRFAATSLGSWSSSELLPMGAVENVTDELTWTWQIEHQGAWHWELGGLKEDLYLQVSGPTDVEHQWRQGLVPGESFTTVPVAVAATRGGLDDGLRALTAYRRAMRRPQADHSSLPVIFNDYMNCLWGDPSAAKLSPLIKAAAETGAEYFVIDAGWYADDSGWWDTVGAWEPSQVRFPDGLGKTIQEIHDAGLVPGLWLEPEVVGVRSEIAEQLPPDAFFWRDGQRIAETGRYHLDFRSAAVRERMDAVVDGLITQYGVGYFKLDYNINLPGTDALGEAPGAGLLGHNRAYLSWLDQVLDRHPGLVLESCASGGMRADYAMLARMTLHSTSDQVDLFAYAPIAAAAPSAVTPEQGAVWAYPRSVHTPEEASFALVNALLGRIHLSGRPDEMDADQLARVAAAVATYKDYRPLIARAEPYWPLGLPGWYDDKLALALVDGDTALLAVWHRGEDSAVIEAPLPGSWRTAEVLFPSDLPTELELTDNRLRIGLPNRPSARLVRLAR
ncbi:glycoside hydrolase family 36 protein [Kribbella sp. NPDC005582]|uniref:glycoside hydrolase family 36 protein n=1 Tax=Kribbella sp. NPDC005582 TaxID=3156893 RepID=UPI0033B41D2E